MKQLFFLLSLFVCAMAVSGQQPAWVTSHPATADAYVAVGTAPLSDPNYRQKATQNALVELAAQIATSVNASSFMHALDVDGKQRELYEDKVQQSMVNYLEGHELKDSYSDDEHFYVLYSLDRKLYAANLEKHRLQVIRQGLDYYSEAQADLSENRLMAAVMTLGKGLEMVAPWTFADLTIAVDGRNVDVAGLLYRTWLGVFEGLTLVAGESAVEAVPFKAIDRPLTVRLLRRGNAVPNVPIKAEFVRGNGELASPVGTDAEGVASFYVSNLSSSASLQEVRFSIDEAFFASLPEAYAPLVGSISRPEARVLIRVQQQATTAFVKVVGDDLSSCSRQIVSLLANNHFTVTEKAAAAQVTVELAPTLELAGTVPGDMYDLNECYCSLTLKFIDSKTRNVLLNYTVDRLRVLTPANKSVEQTEQMCVHELMKRVNRELPNKLRQLSL